MRKTLYDIVDPFTKDFLQVSSLHRIFYEVSGLPSGKPALILHGGPGGGSHPKYRGAFDPLAYKIVQFDQRGAGQSTPHACTEENTTWDLISDIEKLREFLKIDKWHVVFGGSWGSTLSLAYAETHPNRVERLILRGIFLCRWEELNFFYQEGTSWVFPEAHEEFRSHLPEVEQRDIIHAYYRRIAGNDQDIALKYAKEWTKYEQTCSRLFVDPDLIKKSENDEYSLAFAKIETHYFVNGIFMRSENQLLEDTYRIKDIPTVIVQGRYDMVCPAKSAWDLHQRLSKSKLVVVPDAGHSFFEEGIIDALVQASDEFKKL